MDFFEARKFKVLVHLRFAEFLLNLRLKDVQLVLHVPVDVREALLGCIVVSMLSLFVGKRRNHAIVELFDFCGWVIFAAFISWGTF